MSADLLRRAAAVLRDHANTATPGPWTATGDQREVVVHNEDPGDNHEVAAVSPCGDHPGRLLPDSDYIALMHPLVALHLANWLSVTAAVADANDEHDGFDLDAVDDTHQCAVAAARAILRQDA